MVAGLLIIFGLTYWMAYSNYQDGEKYLRAKAYSPAILAFEQTILNHFPGSPYQKKAVSSLMAIGDQASAQKNIPIALQAYQAVLFAQASLSVYRKLPAKDSQLALDRLRAINPHWAGPRIPHPFPHRLWSFILGLSLLLWILSLFFLIQTGFDPEGKIKRPAAYYPLGLLVITFSLWLSAIINV
jgi:hypothetical protein